MSELTELTEKILGEIAEEFKEQKDEAWKTLKDWASILAELKIEKFKAGGDKDKIAELERSEAYAWAGILAMKAKYAAIIEEKIWALAERILRTVKNVFLSP